MSAWVNPDTSTANDASPGIFDLLDTAIKTGGQYLIADKTGSIPAGFSRSQNTGATPAHIGQKQSAATVPTMLGANAMFNGVDMRYVAAGFGILLLIGLILRR